MFIRCYWKRSSKHRWIPCLLITHGSSNVATGRDYVPLSSPGTDAKSEIHVDFYPKRIRSAQAPISGQCAPGTQQWIGSPPLRWGLLNRLFRSRFLDNNF